MNSRRFTAQYLPVLERKDSTPRYCRTAGFQSPQCPVWVSRVGLMRRRRSRHVRFYSDSVQTLEAQRNDALCHEPTYAVQQIARLFDCLAGIRGTEHYGTRKIDFAKTSQAITAVALQSRFVLLSPRREYYRPAHFAGSCVIGMRMTRGYFDSTSFRIGLVLIGRFHVADDAP
jgi:hypothetical protein